MVSTWHPAGVFSFHARFSYEHILNRIIKYMPHVEYPCHIRRWDDYTEGFSVIGYRVKVIHTHPVCIPFFFYFSRLIPCRNFHMGTKIEHIVE